MGIKPMMFGIRETPRLTRPCHTSGNLLAILTLEKMSPLSTSAASSDRFFVARKQTSLRQ
jgi:hypothetical protein